MITTLTNTVKNFSHLFFPHNCAGCGTDALGHELPLCIRCMNELPLTNFHFHAGNPVEKTFWGRLPVTTATSLCYFTNKSLTQTLLHRLKYEGDKETGIFLGRLMGKILLESNRFNDVDVLVPLPLFAARERKRGYNQAAIVCNGMAEAMRRPVIKNAVARLSATTTQTHKNRVERWQNMEGRFELMNSDLIQGKHVLLVDDVITTGATLEACGQEILKAPGTRLSIATLACTL